MKSLSILPFRRWFRYGFLSSAILCSILNSLFLISILDRAVRAPLSFKVHLTVGLFFFCVPTFLGWLSFGMASGMFFVVAASVFSALIGWATQMPFFLIFILYQAVLIFLLFVFKQKKDGEVVASEVEIEKAINERNDLELTYKEKGTSISVSFEKYASYYNLRNLASDFSTTLSLSELSQLVVSKTMELLG